jgi:hypothetical protein
MSGSVESEARRALMRLRRAVEKVGNELDNVAAALRHAEGQDFPASEFAVVAASVASIQDFIREQSERLEEKILHAGGLEPGRIRRSSS